MSYGLSFNSGHGHRSTRYRYSPDFFRGGTFSNRSRGGASQDSSWDGADYGPRHYPLNRSQAHYRSRLRDRNKSGASDPRPAAKSRSTAPDTPFGKLDDVAKEVIDFLGLTPSTEKYLSFHESELESGKILLGVFISCSIFAGYGLFALARLAARSLRKTKTAALNRDLASRKALHVLHDHARHRPPTPEMLRKYWLESRKSLEGKLLLGSLMGDLAVTVDASYVRGDDGEIVGRQGGIKGWLDRNAPDMMRHYKTLMHYKAVADKFRVYCGVQEPDGAEEALGLTIPEHAATALQNRERHPKAAELLAACRTMATLHAVVCDGLGLVRVRRRTG